MSGATILEYQSDDSGNAIIGSADYEPIQYVGFASVQEAEEKLKSIGAKMDQTSYAAFPGDRPGDAELWCLGERTAKEWAEETPDMRRKFEVVEVKGKDDLTA